MYAKDRGGAARRGAAAAGSAAAPHVARPDCFDGAAEKRRGPPHPRARSFTRPRRNSRAQRAVAGLLYSFAARAGTKVREGCDIKSKLVCDLPQDAIVVAVEEHPNAGNPRLRICRPAAGWLSKKTVVAAPLPAPGPVPKTRTPGGATPEARAARAGISPPPALKRTTAVRRGFVRRRRPDAPPRAGPGRT